MNKQKIIIITSGSFQGKSIISLKTAARLNLSGVLTTDMVRNILNINFPKKKYLSTSTYLLSESDLKKQKADVCLNVKNIIKKIYIKRGENIIIEGMHFNDNFLKWALKKKFCCICLNNTTSLPERIILKQITRNKLNFIDKEGKIHQNNSLKINSTNVLKTSYMIHAKRIKEISNEILILCKRYEYKIINFTSLDNAVDDTVKYILNFYK